MPETELKPEICNCVAARQAARHITQFYNPFLAPSGLRTTQAKILASLRRPRPAVNDAARPASSVDR